MGVCRMARKPDIEFKCDKCGKLQPKNNEKSNNNFDVFDCNQTCECGGKFCMYMNGLKIG